jgi:lipopolysaccharide biosynthesis regulator YciM
MKQSTIMIDKKTIELLKRTKEHPRETYNELLKKLVMTYQTVKKKNQYDEFLHKIQQEKMQEVWDNKSDEEWENA